MQPNENFLIVLENQNCQPISGQDTSYLPLTSYLLPQYAPQKLN
jgi:hypothetical protein